MTLQRLKAGGDPLVERAVRQQVAGELLDGELVERQIAVERVDHPIAIGPHLAVVVEVDAVRVAVARGVQPVAGAVFAVVRRGEIAVHHALVGVGRVSFRNASSSAGFGGRPVRSSATRRISVRRSASGAGARRSASRRSRE